MLYVVATMVYLDLGVLSRPYVLILIACLMDCGGSYLGWLSIRRGPKKLKLAGGTSTALGIALLLALIARSLRML